MVKPAGVRRIMHVAAKGLNRLPIFSIENLFQALVQFGVTASRTGEDAYF
jgi:hypothetical protein